MSRKLWLAATLLLATAGVSAGNIKGSVKDAKTGEEIIGAYVVIQEEPSNGTVTGMDGSFSLSTNLENYTLVCKYMGYSDRELSVYPGMKNVEIALDSDDFMLDDITVTADNTGRRDAGARLIERQSMNVVNVMSARSMELSPDITVANVIQRMSGVTVERNSSGEGQYAILRGMDKRYNYTLINGVKVSSPDNKNRFVPLDTSPLLDKYRKDTEKYPDAGKQDMDRQLAWIDSVLTAATEDWVLVVGHHPIYAYTDKSESERLDMQKRVDSILRKHGNVDMYLCGHIHNFQHIRKKGCDMDYVVNSSGSLSRPNVEPVDGTVFCSGEPGYSLITVDKKELCLHMVDKNGNIIHTIKRTKK